MKKHLAPLLLATFVIGSLFTSPVASLARTDESAGIDETQVDQSGEILSYAELLALPVNQRIEYVQGVRDILIEISKTKNGRFSDESPEAKSKLEAWLKLLNQEIDSVQAQAPASCAANPDCRAMAASCFQKSRGLEFNLGTGQYNCGEVKEILLQKNPTKMTEGGDFRRYLANLSDPKVEPATALQTRSIRRPIPLFAPEDITTKTVSVNAEPPPPPPAPSAPAPLQAPPSSFDRGLAGHIGLYDLDIKRFGCISSERTSSPAKEIAGSLKPCRAQQEAEILKHYELSRQFTSPPESAPVKTLVLPQAASAPRAALAREHDPLPESEAVRAEVVESHQEPAPPRAKEPVSPASKPPVATSSASSIPNSAAMKLSCAPKIQKCDDPNSVRSQVAKPEQPCVFAGMVSKFDSRNRRCVPVVNFKVGDLDLKCASGQTMCNPLLFGTVNSTTPICIGRGQDATLQCSKLSAPRDAERFFNRDVVGMQNNWDDFRSKLSKVCSDGPSQKFHCNECNILNTRLFELEVRVIGRNLRCTGRTTLETVHEHRRQKRARGTKTSK